MSSREDEDGFDLDDPAGVLAWARAAQQAEHEAAAAKLRAAAAWAAMHSADSLVEEADWLNGRESALPLGGAGAPEVAEYAVAELAAALGLSPVGGRRYLGRVVELRYRLPRTHARTIAGEIPAWKALRVAEATVLLSPEAARFVDEQVWWCADSTGVLQLDRTVQEAITRFDPDLAEKQRQRELGGRHVNVRLSDAATGGLGSRAQIDAVVDLADGRDFEEALRQGAGEQRLLGSTDSLDLRRARALGAMARRDLTLAFDTRPETGGEPGGRKVRPPQVVWHVHSQVELEASGLVRVEETGGFISMAEFRSWMGPDTQLTIKPVIDLAEHISVDRYEVPDRLKAQTSLKLTRCIHPHCNRRARNCDQTTPSPTARTARAGRPVPATSRRCADSTIA